MKAISLTLLLGSTAAYATAAALPRTVAHSIEAQDSEAVRIGQLDHSLLPVGDLRLIFIGDIHGCREELVELLNEAYYDEENDHIIAVGDIANKEPHTIGVIDHLMSKKTSSVHGNHEERIVPLAESGNFTEEYDDVNSGPEAIAQALIEDQLAYLQAFPHILRIGDLDVFNGETIIAHAGLVPGVAHAEQDPESVMNMRALNAKILAVSDERAAEGEGNWFVVWDEHHFWYSLTSFIRKLLGHSDDGLRATVISGHDSRLGLQLGSYYRGLDTRRSAGGSLTALVVSDGGTKEALVTVECPNCEDEE